MRTLSTRSTLVANSLVAVTLALAACAKPDAKPDALPTPPTGPTSQPTSSATPAAGDKSASGEHHADHGKGAVDRDTVDADGVVRRGTPLTPDLETLSVSAAVAKAKELDGKKVKLTGKVESVCQPMGCWFVVQGDKPEDKVRISTKAHNIFVPKSSVGNIATVEGTITIKTLTKETAQHYEDERELKPGETRKTFTGDVTELSIDVVGLEMKKPSA